MKRILNVVVTILLCVTFSSCSKDDPKPASNDSPIIGSWRATKVSYTGTSTTSSAGMSFNSSFTGEGYNINNVVVFNKQPQVYTSTGNYSVKLTTTIDGFEMENDVTDITFFLNGAWSINEQTLTLTPNNGAAQSAKIIQLDAQTLMIEGNARQTTTQNGATVVTDTEINFTFVKQ